MSNQIEKMKIEKKFGEIEIRQAKKKDVEPAYKIYSDLFKGFMPIDMFSVTQEDDPEIFFVATYKGKVVGYAIGTVCFRKIFLISMMRIFLKIFTLTRKNSKSNESISKLKILFSPKKVWTIVNYLYEHCIHNAAYISNGVKKEFQGKGIGARLFKARLEAFDKKGVDKIVAFTRNEEWHSKNQHLAYRKLQDGVFTKTLRKNR